MDAKTTNTIEASLESLAEALIKAADDFTGVHGTLELARVDLAARNGSVPRGVIVAATRAVDHLRLVEDALRDMLKALVERE